ncbi:MAG: hypothetical protein FJ144_11650 [Deltaproteobacteria bacterium]|nr:hypothetical protein [Deltaproteobacteria bacterium]
MRNAKRETGRAIVFASTLALLAPAAAEAQEDWKGMSSLEQSHAKVDKPSTLRIIRFGTDPEGAISDQGSIVGWSAAAATGTIEPRTEPSTTESLEVMKRSEVVDTPRTAQD